MCPLSAHLPGEDLTCQRGWLRPYECYLEALFGQLSPGPQALPSRKQPGWERDRWGSRASICFQVDRYPADVVAVALSRHRTELTSHSLPACLAQLPGRPSQP